MFIVFAPRCRALGAASLWLPDTTAAREKRSRRMDLVAADRRPPQRTAATNHLRKPFYHLDEMLTRWGMTERDIAAFVLADELTVSATVSGLRIEYGTFEECGDEGCFRIPEGTRFTIGTVELAHDDAWRILREGSWAITSLKSEPGRYQNIDGPNWGNKHQVQRDDLVICRAEIERFEQAQGLLIEAEAPIRRGAPSQFDWDAFWVEVCRGVHADGLPVTQNELVGRMAAWFELNHKKAPDESTIKKKLKPLWRQLTKPDQRPSPTKLR
jgi:hypothetical protein